MAYPSTAEQLSRPLLSDEDEEKKLDAEDAVALDLNSKLATSDKNDAGSPNDDDDDDDDNDGGGEDQAEQAAADDEDKPFTIKSEIVEMASLALPLAISFFCRMGMAR